MNIWSKLEVSGILENAWARSGMLRNPWRCLRTLRNTQECAGPHVEAFGAVRSTHLQFWLPQGNDQPSLGIAKTHLESFDRLWHAREYEGMHCCCACLRMSRFPFPCCTGDGKRSRAVDVIYLRAKPIVKGGLGGNRSWIGLMGFNFRDFFLCFF